MRIASLVLGIISISIMVLAFLPCLGWVNWLNFPIALTGLILGLMSYNKNAQLGKNNGMAGIILCSVALFLGLIRLFFGMGIF